MGTTSNLLGGKRLLVTGVVNADSIACATAVAAIDAGAEVVLSSLGRDLERTRATAAAISTEITVLEADLTNADHVDELSRTLGARWGGLDGILHAVAFAPREALAGEFLAAGIDPVARAFHTSVHTYAVMANLLAALAPARGGSLVGLDFDAARAWPVYNWMGVCKAALESANRYTARDLGPRCIRTNLIAAGPLHTRAAGAIADFERLTTAWESQAPMAWDPDDAGPVADVAVFLFSDLARMVTGEILHVDGGFHAMAAPVAR